PLGSRSGTAGEYTNYQLKSNYERQLGDSVNIIGGVDGLLATFVRSDSWAVTGNTVTYTPSGYTQPGKWFLGGAYLQGVITPWKQISLTLGGRYDTFQKEANPRLTPRLGLVYKPIDSLAFKALYGQSYLAPMWAHKRANDGNFV